MAQELSLEPVSETIFTNDELNDYVGSQIKARASDHVKIICGCTSTRYGHKLGVLRISVDGTTCRCYHECKKVFDSPHEFVKHCTGTSSLSNWRSNIWVLNNHGQKIKLSKTCFLKYYSGDQYRRPHNISVHRDQKLRCSACSKLRCFVLHSKEACRYYHDAAANENRTCSDMIPGRLSCEALEERSSWRTRTGCRRNIRCKECVSYVCFGCETRRFEDCNCRTCTDFYDNAPNQTRLAS